ncbi:MAG TPA: SDR family NAD(P)-dependent oxidoreductase, partial [Thermoanaerobaculia bacterium]
EVAVVHPGDTADWGALIDRLAPARIVHLWSTGTARDLEQEQERGFYSLLDLARALGDRRPAEARHPLHLGIVSTGMQRITGADALVPARATLLGPAAVLPQEYPGITCAAVDVTLPPPNSREERRLIDLLLAELATPADPVVAYRGTDRWLRVFEPLPLARPEGPPPLRAGGTWLITGGLGGVGLELAGLLARLAKGTLVLTGRSPFPERESWSELARGAGRTAETARRLLALEAAGAEVWPAAADVTDAASMHRLLGEVRRRCGRIDGVIHAAGLAGGGLMQLRTVEAAGAVLAPKVHGTLLLAELLAEDPPGVLILCSSLNALIGGPGQFDYAAANAFLDAFAWSRRGDLPVVSINWGTWRGTGMAAQRLATEEMLASMAPEDAVEAFGRLLAGHRLPQVAVSVRPLPDVLAWARSLTAEGLAASVRPAPGGHARPALAMEYVAPQGELEERLAALWSDVLGLDRVGARDDFFELGGHSLMATRLLTRVRETFAVEIPLRRLFDAPTVAGLAEWIRDHRGDPALPDTDAGLPPAVPDPEHRHEPFPLSGVQQAYWLGRGATFELGNLATHAYLEIEADRLDLRRLETAWQRLVERHGMLRAVILPDGTQRILEQVPAYRIETQDLRSLPPAEATARLEAIRSEMEEQVLPVDRWPLFE